MNVIEQALSEFFSSPGRQLSRVAKDLGAIPLYRSWTGTVFLDTKGQFLFRDEENHPVTVRVESDRAVQLLALAEGSRRYMSLANLLPPRQDGSATCERCAGEGQITTANGTSLFCGECHGVGWPAGPDWSPLDLLNSTDAPRYPTFAAAIDALQAFTAERYPGRKPRFAAASQMDIRGRKLYVHLQDGLVAMKRARATYRHAARKRLGVLISALGELNSGEMLTYVYGPRDPDEAQRLMYPDGLKLSLGSPFDIVAVGGFRWGLMRRVGGRASANDADYLK